MKKISVRLCIDVDDDTEGFVIVPTRSREILDGNKYVVDTPGVARGSVNAWGCKNSVTLKENASVTDVGGCSGGSP